MDLNETIKGAWHRATVFEKSEVVAGLLASREWRERTQIDKALPGELGKFIVATVEGPILDGDEVPMNLKVGRLLLGLNLKTAAERYGVDISYLSVIEKDHKRARHMREKIESMVAADLAEAYGMEKEGGRKDGRTPLKE